MSASDFKVYILPDENGKRDELLRRTASMYSGLDSGLFIKASDELGKPYFAGLEGIFYSISHSGGYWACAYGTENVGLDLQRHDECRRESIAKRFFHSDEKKYLEEKNYAPEEFFAIWTKKESYIKYVGQGLSLGLDSFSVLGKMTDCEIKKLTFKDGYSLCICAKEFGDVEINIFD